MKLSRCSKCRQSKIEVLVYKNGLRRRTRVVQCPNHCDLKCPRCDSDVRVTLARTYEKNLKCRGCSWKGHSPDRDFNYAKDRSKRLAAEKRKELVEEKKRDARMAKANSLAVARKAKRDALRFEILKKIDLNELRVGSECPFCKRRLVIKKSVVRSARWGFEDTNRRLTCGDTVCDSTFWEETVTMPSEGYSEVSICNSCRQPIRNETVCGCS